LRAGKSIKKYTCSQANLSNNKITKKDSFCRASLCEFDFRYNKKNIEDNQRANNIVLRFVGKRLTYQDSFKA
jgi:hypothetical protein